MSKRTFLRLPMFHLFFWPLFLIIGCAVTWAAWLWHAEHRLEATKARMRAAGFRFEAGDFPDGAMLPANENGFNDYSRAMKAFKLSEADRDLISGRNIKKRPSNILDIPRTPEEMAQMRGLLHQEVLDALDACEMRPQMVWPRAIFDDVWFIENREKLVVRSFDLARLLCQVALFDHRAGLDVEALKNLRRVITLSRAAVAAPAIITQSLGTNDRTMVAEAIFRMEKDLHVERADVVEQVRRLAGALLDDGMAKEGESRGFEGEVTMSLPGVTADAVSHSKTFSPFLLESVSSSLEQWEAVVAIAQAPNWQRAKPLFAKVPSAAAPSMWTAFFHHYDIRASLGRERYENLLMTLTKSRAAAVILAARCFEETRMGAAQTAADLADDMLQKMPVDPFADNDQPLRYRVDRDGPTVWSVGEDGKDDGGLSGSKTDLVFGAAASP